MLIFQMMFINECHQVYLFFLFTLAFHGRVPVTPLIPYNVKFIQRGFTERAAFDERIPRAGRVCIPSDQGLPRYDVSRGEDRGREMVRWGMSCDLEFYRTHVSAN
jgi:hypothetical protein